MYFLVFFLIFAKQNRSLKNNIKQALKFYIFDPVRLRWPRNIYIKTIFDRSLSKLKLKYFYYNLAASFTVSCRHVQDFLDKIKYYSFILSYLIKLLDCIHKRMLTLFVLGNLILSLYLFIYFFVETQEEYHVIYCNCKLLENKTEMERIIKIAL